MVSTGEQTQYQVVLTHVIPAYKNRVTTTQHGRNPAGESFLETEDIVTIEIAEKEKIADTHITTSELISGDTQRIIREPQVGCPGIAVEKGKLFISANSKAEPLEVTMRPDEIYAIGQWKEASDAHEFTADTLVYLQPVEKN